MKLTAKVEVDGGGDLAELVLGLDFVQAGVGLDDIVELKDDHVGANLRLGGPEARPVIFHHLLILAEPVHFRLRIAAELALEDEPVAIVLLSELWFFHEFRCFILAHRTHVDDFFVYKIIISLN